MNMETQPDVVEIVESETNQKNFHRFLEAIGRPDIQEIVNPKTPLAYWTMEIYRDDIKGQGGLGMLASDTLEVAKREGIPAVFITPFYPKERHQKISGLKEETELKDVAPEERGFTNICSTFIHTRVGSDIVDTPLSVYSKQIGSVTLLSVTEPNFGELYQGDNNSDHRLYQEVVLGFGGFRAMQKLGLRPSMNQLNEAPTVFAALAQLDEETQKSGNIEKSFAEIRQKEIYTNHTLVQAVEASFEMYQIERFVIPNIENEEVKKWLRNAITHNGGHIKLSSLAFELADRRNGVSQIHAQEASKTYKDLAGDPVTFEGVTNGISLERWGDPDLLAHYQEAGVLNELGLPTPDYKEKIELLDWGKIDRIKEAARLRLRESLQGRRNQYDEQVDIPAGAKVFDWKRRFAGYKRPGMVFEDANRLAKILEENDAYYVMVGRTHPNDEPMQTELTRLLIMVNRHPVLRKRVHFIQDYDEPIARALAQGSDIALNTPIVRDADGLRISTEACGTSWLKAILGNTLLISTPDGGVADPEVVAARAGRQASNPIFEISGNTYQAEVESLYQQMETAVRALNNIEQKHAFIKRQLEGYLPIISGARMEGEYLALGFPPKKGAMTNP